MSVYSARSGVAIQVRKIKKSGGDPDAAPAVQDAKRLLAEAKLRQAIERAIASAPPLTAEQRDRLALLLSGSGVSGASPPLSPETDARPAVLLQGGAA